MNTTKKFKKGDEVICINADGTKGITVGNAYLVGGSDAWHNSVWIAVCDDNDSAEYLESRFRLKTAEDTAATKELPALPGAKELAELLRGKVRSGTHPSNTRIVIGAADVMDELRAALESIAEYTGEGPATTDWRAIVRAIGEKARAALAANQEG